MESERVKVDRTDRRALNVPWSRLIGNKAHEFWVKARGKRIKGQGMIAADTTVVQTGFTKLAGVDFAEYNLPQAWVESRQIPQVLDGRLPKRDAWVIDLGCGPGTSTKLICHFADASWSVVGYDFVDAFIDEAKRNAEADAFRSRSGAVVRPSFVCQDITEPLLLDGQPLPDASFHLALSGGVVGLYLHPDQCGRLVAELDRVVVPGGYIALDAGPSIPEQKLRKLCEQGGFRWVGKAKSFVIEPRPKLIFQKPG